MTSFILDLLRMIFRFETNADDIFAPLDNIVRKANAHAEHQAEMAGKEAERAKKLQEKIDARKAEIAKTERRAANVKKLMELAD